MNTTTFPQVKLFTIYCSTGCSCCHNENHYRGPFSTRQIAEARVTDYRKESLLASQYARNGVYQIYEETAEQLPDGRLITGHLVYKKFVDDECPGSDEERIYDND